MTLTLEGINWLVVLVAGVLHMFLGALWYSPYMFAERWMQLIGKTADDIEPDRTVYVFAFVAALLSAVVLAVFINGVGADTLVEGGTVGVVAWLGFVATSTLVYTIFEGPPRGVWLIFAGYQLVAYIIMGALIGAL